MKAPAIVLRERQREDFGLVPHSRGAYDVFACGCWVFAPHNVPSTGVRFACPRHPASPFLHRAYRDQMGAS